MFEKIFEMKTMKDYHGLYLKWNVLLLANMFEKKIFRNNSLKNLSRDATLKVTKTELELILDPDTYIFFEKGIRGGISYISNRCRKAIRRNLKSYEPKTRIKTNYILRRKWFVWSCNV